MRFTIVILSAMFCLQTVAESSIDGTSDEALVAAAEQLIAEEKPQEPVAQKLKESEIPIVAPPLKAPKSQSQLIWNLVASLGVVVVVAASLLYAVKKWGKTGADKGGKAARIEIMHQLHVSPRRSIALIRVSGETILVGITDYNISMLKSVTLIDDELEKVANKDFNGFLEDEFSIEDVRNALAPRA